MGIPIPARVMLAPTRLGTVGQSKSSAVHSKNGGAPLYPDVAIIHVHRADAYGNAQIDGITVSDFDVARAAKRVIITAERLIPHEEIRKDPSRTIIPYYCVDAVCHVPYGSYPGNMPYEYFSDEEHLREWLASDADVTTLQPFLQKYIYGTKDFSEYLELCGGEERLLQLRDLELLHKAGPHPSHVAVLTASCAVQVQAVSCVGLSKKGEGGGLQSHGTYDHSGFRIWKTDLRSGWHRRAVRLAMRPKTHAPNLILFEAGR